MEKIGDRVFRIHLSAKGCGRFSFSLKIYLGAVAPGELRVASGGTCARCYGPTYYIPVHH